jgi:hypothetical protein
MICRKWKALLFPEARLGTPFLPFSYIIKSQSCLCPTSRFKGPLSSSMHSLGPISEGTFLNQMSSGQLSLSAAPVIFLWALKASKGEPAPHRIHFLVLNNKSRWTLFPAKWKPLALFPILFSDVRNAIPKWWSKKHLGVTQQGKKKSFTSVEGSATDHSLIGRTQWAGSQLSFYLFGPHPDGWDLVHNLCNWLLRIGVSGVRWALKGGEQENSFG